MAKAIIAVLFLSVIRAGTGIEDFRGASKIAHSIENETAELLVYANNANELGILRKGSILPLDLHTRLISTGCCSHRATPSLSLDGRYIAYVRLTALQPRREAIIIYDLESKTDKVVFEAEVIWGVSWAPASDKLAAVADRAAGQSHNLYIVNLTSQAVSEQTHGPLHIAEKKYTISNHVPPSWSPSGAHLAIEVRSIERQAEDSAAGSIVLWDLQSNQFRKLSDGVDPAWSPNGDEIAFFDTSRQKCLTIRPDGRERKLLFTLGKRPFPSSAAPLFYPVVWSPDTNQLIFHQWVDADLITDIYRFNLKTGKLKFIGNSELQVVNWRTRR